MSGFPNRPNRSAFGPTRQDERPVENPVTELGADDMNLDFHQNAGMGLVIQRVAILVGVSGAAIVSPHAYQGLAWDPTQSIPDIPVTYNGVGDYTVNFLSSYDDEKGTPVATALKGGQAIPQGSTNLNGIIELPDAQTVTVKLFQADTGAAIDSNFFLILW